MSSSGIRGIVGETLTEAIATDVGMSFGTYVNHGTVVIGGDTRESHDLYKSAVIKGLTAVGCSVIDIGTVPTPTVQQLVRHNKAQGGVVITASHNPIQWNGIKLMNASGSFMNSDEYSDYSTIYSNRHNIQPSTKLGSVTIQTNAIDIHIDRILNELDTSHLKSTNLKVLIDPNNGTGCLATPKLFNRIGINPTFINAEPNGQFTHTPEPIKQNLSQIINELKNGDYDIGFVQDPDADRLVIIAGDGTYIGEDVSLGLCIDYILKQDPSPTKSVVVNLSTSNVINSIAKKHNATLTQTKIGEPNVTHAIKTQNATVGGEGNGGVIFPKVGWGRDSLVGMVIALKYLAESQLSVNQIVNQYPTFHMLRDKFTVDSHDQVNQTLKKINDAFSTQKKDTQDGIKIIYDNSWIHIRASNTEPIIRLFIEAPTQNEIQIHYQTVKNILES